MAETMIHLDKSAPLSRHGGPWAGLPWVIASLGVLAFSGCAAFTNPVANGIPVRLLPPELLAETKSDKVPIPLSCLKRKPPEKYVLQSGDVLSVFIEGVLGPQNQAPPVNFAEGANLPPSLGYPIPVREDGTLPLPLIKPLSVQGMTVEQAEQAIVKAYTSGANRILEPDRARIMVSLLRPKYTRVVVIREDTPVGGIVARSRGVIRTTREFVGGPEELVRGRRPGTISMTLDLPGYDNDLLTALAETGGLPGPDAVNEVVIERASMAGGGDPMTPRVQPPLDGVRQRGPCGEIIRIPIRMPPCQPLQFRPEDIILYEGDVVFIRARVDEFYYTGGLLPSGEFPLPRDYDLDVIQAIAAVGGPLVNGGINSNNLTGQIVQPGIGNPSPRLVTVLRRVPGRGQVPIMVDLTQALRDPRESLLIAPGDVIILQESRDQALARYFSDVFQFNFIGRVINRRDATGTTTLALP
jgi:protein involved in polysaccharide export with SLBB domain